MLQQVLDDFIKKYIYVFYLSIAFTKELPDKIPDTPLRWMPTIEMTRVNNR